MDRIHCYLICNLSLHGLGYPLAIYDLRLESRPRVEELLPGRGPATETASGAPVAGKTGPRAHRGEGARKIRKT